jgi:tetratricopeptide (TPR) repeat protein
VIRFPASHLFLFVALFSISACSDDGTDEVTENDVVELGVGNDVDSIPSDSLISRGDSIGGTRADQMMAVGRYSEALDRYREMPPSAHVLKQMGIANLRLWDLPAAIYAFRRAEKLAPDDDEIIGYLAEAMTYNEDFDEALELYREYLRRNPTNLDARTGLARTLGWVNEYDAAIREFDKVLSEDRSRVDARMGLAEVLTWNKDFDRAIQEYSRVAKDADRRGLRARALGSRAEILGWQGEYDKAITSYRESIELDSSSVETLMGLGQILEWTEKYPEAKRVYARVLGLDPAHEGARAKLQSLLWVK